MIIKVSGISGRFVKFLRGITCCNAIKTSLHIDPEQPKYILQRVLKEGKREELELTQPEHFSLPEYSFSYSSK